MKKYADVTEALADFAVSIENQSNAILAGESDDANLWFDRAENVIRYLIATEQMHHLTQLFDHSSRYVQESAATYLLPYCTTHSVQKLEEIVSLKIPLLSFQAEVVLTEWASGNLSFNHLKSNADS